MKVLLSGCTGSMGKVITELVETNRPDFKIVAGLNRDGKSNYDYPVYNEIKEIKEDIDVVLDFSSHSNLDNILNYSINNKKPLVIASTGYSEEDLKKIEDSSKEIPILFSRNMSIGINLILNVVEKLSKQLDGFDIEIVEKHHKYKADSPSGTAIMLFDAANRGRNEKLFKNESRSGVDLERKEEEVGIHAVRGGTIVGEHSVNFAGVDEVIEVKHTAYSKKIFAEGSLKACSFIVGKEKGLYSMDDIFG